MRQFVEVATCKSQYSEFQEPASAKAVAMRAISRDPMPAFSASLLHDETAALTSVITSFASSSFNSK